jgi:hypothetical protein
MLAAAICSAVIGCPQELRAKIQSSEAMERFADDDTSWNELLKRIGSGEPAWIELEEYLAGLSDGHVTEELTTALGEALIHRPEQMLALIAAGKLGTNAIALCGNIGDDQATRADSGCSRAAGARGPSGAPQGFAGSAAPLPPRDPAVKSRGEALL